MFGLMRAKKCGMSVDEKEFRRLNYCGTCKTIGSIYGQKARLLLNHDTVFLAEVLNALSKENVKDWQKSYQSYNCLSLPKSDLPKPLQFAAATNVILTKFKISDHISDENQSRYTIANQAFREEFKIAENFLNKLGFPLNEVEILLQKQESIEAKALSLDEFAKPTAETTAIFFREGVKFVGREEFEQLTYKFGYAFGKLVYLIDAFEDYEKDFRKGSFNAFRTGFNLTEGKLPLHIKRKIRAIINQLKSEIVGYIYELPFAENQKKLFSLRLTQNVEKIFKTNLTVFKAKNVCAIKPKTTFSERWQKSLETAKTFARSYSWQMPFVFLFILVFAMVAPAQTKEAKSARECFDLSFNLMFIGGILGSVFAVAKPMLSEDSGRLYPDLQQKPKNQNTPQDDKSSWCDSCDCDCCDCCDCGECCCEGCGDGCCDSCDCGCDC